MSGAPAADAGGLKVWHLFVVVGLAGSAVAVFLARDTRVENLVMISVTAMTAIAVGATFHRMLSPFGEAEVVDDSPVLSARARAALEREKMLALRTIKELEFDRAMGKIADADFNDMVGRLRGRAIGIMKQLDMETDGYRGAIERDLRARLEAAGVAPVAAPAATAAPVEARPSTVTCAACGGANDGDARFCKKCGAKLDAYAVTV